MNFQSIIQAMIFSGLVSLSLLFQTTTATADAAPDSASLDEEIQALKQQVVTLNRDLFILEEELLFPSSTQLAVFVSLDTGKYFALDAVQLKIDDKIVANYLYTQRDVDALHRGGVQRFYMGNLKGGEHELVAIYTGKGPHGRDYRRGASYSFEKNLGTKYVELKIVDNAGSEQPDFSIKDWE
jgi:hypothetical protein